jgi:hypothetical protein
MFAKHVDQIGNQFQWLSLVTELILKPDTFAYKTGVIIEYSIFNFMFK